MDRSVAASVAAPRRAQRVMTLLAVGVSLLLAGCGQKGALYLPPPASAASAPAR